MNVYHYAIYEAATGKVLSQGRSTNRRILVLARRGLADGQSLYVGEIDAATTFLPGGFPAPKPVELAPVTAKDVKAHAGRILSYTDWVDIRAIGGVPAAPEMAAYRQAVRDRSGEIEQMNPIPADFTDPKYWPIEP